MFVLQHDTFCWFEDIAVFPEDPFKTAAVKSTTRLSASDTNTSSLADRPSPFWTETLCDKFQILTSDTLIHKVCKHFLELSSSQDACLILPSI